LGYRPIDLSAEVAKNNVNEVITLTLYIVVTFNQTFFFESRNVFLKDFSTALKAF